MVEQFYAAVPSVVSFVVTGAIGWVAKWAVDKYREQRGIAAMAAQFEAFMGEHKLLMDNARNDNKSHIVAVYEKAKERGYITPMELETLNRLFDSYRNLGGNSYIEALMHDANNGMEIVGMPIPSIVAAMDAAGKEK